MNPERINTIWKATFWVWPNDLQKRLDLFEMMVRQEMKK